MRTQTYFHTRFQGDANRRNDAVPLQVNCVGAVSKEQQFSTRDVRRDYYYLYVQEGKMILPGCTLLPGDVMVFEPGYVYQYQSEGETEYLWVHYTGYEACSITTAAHLKPNEKRHIGLRNEIVECFQRLFREFMINDEAAKQLSVCLLREIMALTGRYAGEEKKSNLPLLAIEYIHSHFKEEIDVDHLAQMEHMSCTAFRMSFKSHTGLSPNEYIIAQRIGAACRLLTQTNNSINEIAADVGYADQYYFSRIFKKKVGIPPLKYRTMVLQKLLQDH